VNALFDHDQDENDRLLREEEERRRDLISRAISSYAPHLSGKSGVTVLYLHSQNQSLRSYIRETYKSPKTVVVEHCTDITKERKGVNAVQEGGIVLTLPKRADLVVTKSALNSKTEWLAARLGAMPLVLPEGGDYLRQRLSRRSVLVLVGADQA
jgi:hypothetical protein